MRPQGHARRRSSDSRVQTRSLPSIELLYESANGNGDERTKAAGIIDGDSGGSSSHTKLAKLNSSPSAEQVSLPAYCVGEVAKD